MVDQDRWWEDKSEVRRVGAMLERSGVLPDPESYYCYLEKPWKWSHERKVADALESAMIEAGISPNRGWEMTAVDIIAKAQDIMAGRA